MRKKRTIRTNSSSDRYLITYADLVTLLLGLFVILYTSSQVDTEKYKEVQQAFEKVFKFSGDKPILEGGEGVLEGHSEVLPEPIIPRFREGDINVIEKELKQRLEDYLEKEDIKVYREGDALKIEMPEKLLFQSGKAEIQKKGVNFLDTLTELLKGIPNQIMVDGHTDNVPINNFVYKSNWHLSSARSLNVAYNMIKEGLQETNITVRGFGSQRPVESNSTEKGRQRNRRVEIMISKMDVETPSKKGYKSESLEKQNQF